MAIDNFLVDPFEARRWALQQSYVVPDDSVGWRSKRTRIFRGTLPALKRHFGNRAALLPSHDYGKNGTVYLSLSKGTRTEVPGVHWDEPENSYLALLYLTPNLPVHCGTSFWQHRRTGLMNTPIKSDEKQLKSRRDDLVEELMRDSVQRSRWMETDRVGYQFNRAVAFPAYALHSATNHYGSSIRNGRLYHLICFQPF